MSRRDLEDSEALAWRVLGNVASMLGIPAVATRSAMVAALYERAARILRHAPWLLRDEAPTVPPGLVALLVDAPDRWPEVRALLSRERSAP